MTGPFEADDAATALTPGEREGILPTHVTLRGELNELEQQNITDANAWTIPLSSVSKGLAFTSSFMSRIRWIKHFCCGFSIES